jgi:hypothetical protein
MRVETIESRTSDPELREKLLPKLRGHVFHVTNGTAYVGIRRTGAVLPNDTARYRFSSPSSSNSFGRKRGYICLIDLRHASDSVVDDALDRFYFLDPFLASRVNVFLLLRTAAYATLIPNKEGRAYSPGEVVVPQVEVWYPGRLPLREISTVIRNPVKRPGKWDGMDLKVLRRILRERNRRVENSDLDE